VGGNAEDDYFVNGELKRAVVASPAAVIVLGAVKFDPGAQQNEEA